MFIKRKDYEALKADNEFLKAEVERLKGKPITQADKDKAIKEIIDKKVLSDIQFYKAMTGVKKNGN